MSERTSAQLCRENGWGVGTVLESASGFTRRRIRITAIGESHVLAVQVGTRRGRQPWEESRAFESAWFLTEKPWKAVAPEPAAAGEEGWEPLGMDALCSLFALRKYCDRTDRDGRLICQLSETLAELNHRLFEIEEQAPEPAAAGEEGNPKEAWRTCEHSWGPAEEIRDTNFGVKFGELRTCTICGARLHDDWCASRVGGTERILPPEKAAPQEGGSA